MEDKDFQQPMENMESESKGNTFFKGFGLYLLALGLAVLTVIVLNF